MFRVQFLGFRLRVQGLGFRLRVCRQVPAVGAPLL